MKIQLLLLLMIISACGKVPQFRYRSSESRQNVSPIYGSSRLEMKVFYEKEAPPFTDEIGPLKSWDVLQKNLDALFLGKSLRPQIIVPKSLAEMTKIEDASKITWSVDEIMELAKKHESLAQKETTIFNIFFLKGTFKESSSTLGIHINGTQVIVVFKDIIKATGLATSEVVSKYVEQATLVHEMGHALGLVNNGIPMIATHQDTSHGSHCSNPECVMHHSNEGVTSMTTFAVNAVKNLSLIMFDQHCLDDARNFQK